MSPSRTRPLGQKQPGKQTPLWEKRKKQVFNRRRDELHLEGRAGGIALSESGAGLFTRVVEAVVVNLTLRAGGRCGKGTLYIL